MTCMYVHVFFSLDGAREMFWVEISRGGWSALFFYVLVLFAPETSVLVLRLYGARQFRRRRFDSFCLLKSSLFYLMISILCGGTKFVFVYGG